MESERFLSPSDANDIVSLLGVFGMEVGASHACLTGTLPLI